MPSLRVNGCSYEYAWWGSGEDRAPVVLIHEATGHARGWGEVPQRLAEATDRRVYAYSRAGWGESEPLAGPLLPGYLETEALEVLPAIRDALSLDRVILVGFQEGASIALVHAGASSAPVEGLVAVAPLLCADDALRSEVQRLAARGLPQSMESLASDPEATMKQWAALWSGRAFASWNLDDFARGVTCPVLALRGEGDQMVSAEQLERLRTVVRHAEVVTLAGCRRAPHLEKTAAVVTAMSAFMRGLA